MKNDKRNEYLKKYRIKNYGRLLKYKREWRLKNIDKVHEYERKLRDKDRSKYNQQARLRYQNSKEKELDRIRLKKYGIRGEEFRNLVEKQGYICPICNKQLDKNPSVDHDHNTGKVRGLICNKCNLAIGNAEDSPERLRAMANYLEEYK